MIHHNTQSVRRSFGSRADACRIAIKSVRADKALREGEKNELAECLRQAQEAFERMADVSVANRIADILDERERGAAA